MTSQWAGWRLKSPTSRLFTQPFMQAQIKENIKAPRHWPLWGEFTSDRWIPHKGLVTRKMFPFDDVIMRIPDPNLKYMYDCSQHSDHVDSLSYSLENIISQRYFAHTMAADHNKVIHTFFIVYQTFRDDQLHMKWNMNKRVSIEVEMRWQFRYRQGFSLW